jgi:elongation factor P
MEIGINQIKNSLTIEFEAEVYTVVECEHVKPGKGGAFVRTKLKNIRLGNIIERTFKSNDKVEVAFIEKKGLQYLYSADDVYEFMDHETYDQISLHKDQLGEVINYLKENLEVTAIVHNDKVLTLEPPIFIDMKIISTEPAIRGDTSKAATKPAKIETGMVIDVPLFVNEGDMVRIDTRTKEYVGRAS